MLRQGLNSKILNLTVVLSFLGFGALLYLVINEEERGLLHERLMASELMAKPILHTIYKDMLEERADMPRFLIEGLKTIKGVERVQIIRSNGVEEAFEDLKTVEEVKKEFGEVNKQWLVDHRNTLNNIADGITNPQFKKAIEGFNRGSAEAVYYVEKEGGRNLFTYLVPIVARPKCATCHADEEAARGVLMISTSLEDIYGAIAKSRNRWIVIGVLAIAIITIVLGFLVSAVITRPIDRTVEMLKSIAEGRGDLTTRLPASSDDEIGSLSRWFNKFIEGLQQMVKDIAGTSRGVSLASKEIEGSSLEISAAVNRQLKAVEDTSASVRKMDASVKTVSEEARSLDSYANNVSRAAHSIVESVNDVRTNTENLLYAVASMTSSINEMAGSISHVASLVGNLLDETRDVVSSIMDIGAKVREIEEYSKRQAELAELVRTDAEELGLSSVEKTRQGIEKIKQDVDATESVVNRLGERSREVGKILTVIGDIADTTHMLALNATIMASQAGEQGKGFAVVARQVKDLALRTTASTSEIEGLIQQVQSEAAEAVGSMRRSSGGVAEGIRLSRLSEEALGHILELARRSFDMAKMIESATIDQSKGTVQITKAARMIDGMVNEIKTATEDETEGASEMLKGVSEMKVLMEKVKHSTGIQAEGTHGVSRAMLEVAAKIKTVAGAASDQMELSGKILSAIDVVEKAAMDTAGMVERLETTVKEMKREAQGLAGIVSNFKA